MKRCLLLGILPVLMWGCKPKIPKDIIQPEEMQKILYNIHMTDGYISTITNADSAKKVAASFYKGVYKKFGTDSVQYNKSMDFYYKNPDLMNDMYLKIVEDLKKVKTKLDKIEADSIALAAKKKLKTDSLKAKIKLNEVLKKDSISDSLYLKKKKKSDQLKRRPVMK